MHICDKKYQKRSISAEIQTHCNIVHMYRQCPEESNKLNLSDRVKENSILPDSKFSMKIIGPLLAFYILKKQTE